VTHDFRHYREIAEAGGRMPFNTQAILSMLDEIDDLRARLRTARRLIAELAAALEAEA
jgi:hypothetical protein